MKTPTLNVVTGVHQPAVAADPFADESLVTQATLKQIVGGISDMTVWRWRRAGIIPEPTTIRGRNYWRTCDVQSALRQLAPTQVA